ncbi:MAG: hypothetical protein KKA19_05245 [Candidatus Margulisbacteria bacterium]|nr:hypothetical protein [Candidatus Margulisiibacteriota bacterium]
MPEKKNVGEATKLFDESRPATYLVKVTCSNCGHEGKPEKWSARNILGILFIISGLIPGLIFFNSTNPFVCPNCKKREHLTKIYNNGNKYPIKSYSKNSITAISLAIITLLFIGAFYNARKSGLTYQEEQELKVLESSIVDESVSVPDDFTAKTEIGSIVQSFYEEIEDLQGKQAAKMEELDINYAFFTDLKTLKDVSELIKLREDFRTMREYEVVHYTRSKDLIDDYKEKVATFADKRTYAGKKEDIANFKDGMDKLKEYIGELETFEYSLFDSIDAYLGFFN